MVNSLFLPPDVWEVWSDAEYPSARTPPELGDCQDAGRRRGDNLVMTNIAMVIIVYVNKF